MSIRPRGNSFEVTVERASALPGYRRIRRMRPTLDEATALETEILAAIASHGKWPLTEDDKPLAAPTEAGRWASTQANLAPVQTGTLREAATLALKTHYHGMAWYTQAANGIHQMVAFFEARQLYDIDLIKSADIDAFIEDCRARGNSPSTINKGLGFIRKINEVALKRLPPLATITIPVPHQKGRVIEKWWLRPDDHPRAVQFVRDQGDDLFADLLEVMVFQGFRVEETLRLSTRSFTGLTTDAPWVQVPGTKTRSAQDSIPVYPQALPIILRSVERAKANGWTLLFPLSPRQASTRWNDVREFLGVSHVKTATLKSLRRTFAWYANHRGMPTATLQKTLRHRTISTTAGYLELVGGGEVAQSRDYFKSDPPAAKSKPDLVAILSAFKATGASPEEIARFAKELTA